jgi:hypothetical protein
MTIMLCCEAFFFSDQCHQCKSVVGFAFPITRDHPMSRLPDYF